MPRTCKVCKIKFEPTYNSVQTTCSYQCAIKYAQKQREKKEKKDWNKRKKVLKEKVKTKSDYLKEAQAIFNTYIRLRDENKGCISCGVDLRGRKYDAGHYRSVGGNPQLRFDLNNVHGQCVYCNRHLHGNLVDYRIRLIKRIGLEAVEKLEQDNEPKNYTIPELILLKEEYKEKVRKQKKIKK